MGFVKGRIGKALRRELDSIKLQRDLFLLLRMLEKFLHFSLNVETEKKYKEKVSTTVLTAMFIENSYGYKYSLRICLKLFSNPI